MAIMRKTKTAYPTNCKSKQSKHNLYQSKLTINDKTKSNKQKMNELLTVET